MTASAGTEASGPTEVMHTTTGTDPGYGTVQAISDLHYRFGEALDTNDWPLYRSCLDDPVTAHYEGAGLPPVTVAADDWTSFVAAAVEVQQTVHYFANVSVRRLPDGQIGCRFNHQSCHRVETRGVGEPTNIQYGTYRTIVTERDGRWVISSIHHTVAWATGNPALVDTTTPAFQTAFSRVFDRTKP